MKEMMDKLGLTPEMFCNIECKYLKQGKMFTCQKIEQTINFGLRKCGENGEEIKDESNQEGI